MRKRAPLRMANILRAMDAYQRGENVTGDAQPAPYTDSDEQRAQAAVGLAADMLPFVRAGMSRTLALNLALRIRGGGIGCELRDADGRVCCSECGEPHDDAYWTALYPDEMCRPDEDQVMCMDCAFSQGA